MNWKQFALFVVVAVLIAWVNDYVTSMLEDTMSGLGFIGTVALFLVPMLILYFALSRFVFKRAA